MLQFGFDAAHRGGKASFAIVSLRVSALGGPAGGESLVRGAVGFRTEFQPLPLPPAVVSEPRAIGAPASRRAPGDLVAGAKVAVTLLAVARLGRHLRRPHAVVLRYPIIGSFAVRRIINPHPQTVFAASASKLLPINTLTRY